MLKYIGDGSWLPGVPARDLSEEEVRDCGYSSEKLVRCGLYKIMEGYNLSPDPFPKHGDILFPKGKGKQKLEVIDGRD